MRIAICLIVKNENKYIREWLDYHRNLGFDNIILYDNNDSDGENIYDVIGDEINSGYVVYEEKKDEKGIQLECFNDCLKKYKEKYDWMLFIDCDEFVSLNAYKCIHSWLKQEKFNNAQQILLKFKIYGDNGILCNNESYSVVEKFEKYFDGIDMYEPFNVKTLLNLKQISDDIIFKKQSHFIEEIYNNTFNADGTKVLPCGIIFDECECELRHYKTKSISEYVERHKSDAIFNKVDVSLVSKKIKSFFNINKINEKKIEIVQNTFEWWRPTLKIEKVDVILNLCEITKYTIKSVLNNLPFINKIFLIVNNKNDINFEVGNKVKIIEKKTFIPKKYLNAPNVDEALFFHNIGELSEHFIYVYDGTIINYTCDIEEFFRDDVVCMLPTNISKIPNKYKKMCMHNTLLYLDNGIIDKNGYAHSKWNFGYMYSNTCCPMLKTNNESCFKYMEKYIEKYIAVGREINHWIYPMWYKNVLNTCNFIHSNVKIETPNNVKEELLDPIYKIINIPLIQNESIIKILDERYYG